MSTTLLAALVTAGTLGITHALEPDHVAGISSLTSEYGDSRLSALAGACFSLGHVALVVAWLAVATLLFGRTSFPPVLDALGTLGVGVVLGLLGATMTISGLGHTIRTGEHDHGDRTHSHPRLHLPLPGFDGHQHGHGTVPYLKTGLIGALFTLSPPVSMIVFASTLLPNYGIGAVSLAVLVYTVAITATMSLLGAGVGTLLGVTRQRSLTIHGVVQAVSGLAITALAASLLFGVVSTPL